MMFRIPATMSMIPAKRIQPLPCSFTAPPLFDSRARSGRNGTALASITPHMDGTETVWGVGASALPDDVRRGEPAQQLITLLGELRGTEQTWTRRRWRTVV